MTKRLSTLKPLIGTLSTSVAQPLPKLADSFYHTVEWQTLRKACLERDRYQCQLALDGCQGRAFIADHILSRRNGGSNDLSNLRAVCRSCDNRRKEDHLGRRRGG